MSAITICGSVIRYRGDDVARLLIPEGGHLAWEFAAEIDVTPDERVENLRDEVESLETKLTDLKDAIRRVLRDLQVDSNKKEALLILRGLVR